ncbi:hypothetical protein CLV46_2829 [Diaminobutyricimonas aerilata]|uniref:Tfp pilus assembly protein PilO n=1 Tax=Diaminobutyricimonas aerilata TaxID=1162967 RepID=A0A2M9CMW5_9MICO|nr:hypothetical protein [Diaminobutyricimonas aerilata]PJJ73243.1 hypothetical protein CLV46_2829 [Diaminobutyricimonas aerilata]
MSVRRLWVLGGTLLIVAIVALGWFVGIAPKLTEIGTAAGSILQTEADNALHEQQLAVLEEKFAGIDALRDELAGVATAIPPKLDPSGIYLQLNDAIAASGAGITSATLGTPVLYGAPSAGAPAPEAPPADAPADGEATDAAPPAAPAPAIIDPLEGAAPVDPTDAALVSTGNLVAVPLDLQVKGDVAQVVSLVDALRNLPRLFLVKDFSVDGSGEESTASISAYVYVLVPSASASPATSPDTVPGTAASE